MGYYGLSDESTQRAWDLFVSSEEEWKKDPENKDKFLTSRKAFQEYDNVRMKFYELSDSES